MVVESATGVVHQRDGRVVQQHHVTTTKAFSLLVSRYEVSRDQTLNNTTVFLTVLGAAGCVERPRDSQRKLMLPNIEIFCCLGLAAACPGKHLQIPSQLHNLPQCYLTRLGHVPHVVGCCCRLDTWYRWRLVAGLSNMGREPLSGNLVPLEGLCWICR